MNSGCFQILVVCTLCCAMWVAIRTEFTQASKQLAAEAPDQIRVRHAEACLELAELQWQSRLAQNRRVPNTFHEKELRRYEMNVAVARERLAAAKTKGDVIGIQLEHAKQKAEVATADYEEAKAVRQSTPDMYSDQEMDELRLKAEIAQTRYAIWNHSKANLVSLMDHMHWQLEQVSEEVLEIQRRVEKLESP